MRPLILICTFLVLVGVGGAYAGFVSGLSRFDAVAGALNDRDTELSGRLSDLESTVLLLARDSADIRLGQQAYEETQSAEDMALTEALSKLSSSVSAQE